MDRIAQVLLVGLAVTAVLAADEFSTEIRPVLVEHCQACHDPAGENPVRFLEAKTGADLAGQRDLWRNVAMQLRNRTMPPAGPQPPEADRVRVSSWIDRTLRATACDQGVFAGPAMARRLTRSEYQNTVRDLFGQPFALAELFPVDGSGGEGFDNNAETLFMSPLLAERYLEVTQQILEQVVITPVVGRSFTAKDLYPDREVDEHDSVEMVSGDAVSRDLTLFADGDYDVSIRIRSPEPERLPTAELLVDGARAAEIEFPWSAAEASGRNMTIPLDRGSHRLTFAVGESSVPLRLVSIDVERVAAEPDLAVAAAHFRLFGRRPGDPVLHPRREARTLLGRFVARAFRRDPLPGEVDRFLDLFDRSAESGDPFEESIRLALAGVLVAPDFLFLLEDAPESPGLHSLSDHELATRLSYFLWGSMPDAELALLARAGQLQDEVVLAAQVDRLLDDPRSTFFARTFMGQWLGTKDVGGRVAPTLNEIQHFYTPRIAADMRAEPVLLFRRLLDEDRSLLELIDGRYTYLTERLARHYGMPDAVEGNEFRLVETPDGRRGGLLGLGAVQAMNAQYKRSSPVLRGVWVLETLLGVRLPAPPPDIPALEEEAIREGARTTRDVLGAHRADPTCAACHDIIDPIGFGFEHYDWLGRWRDVDETGHPVDASGSLPSGESFRGLDGLRGVLMSRRDEFLRHVARKLLGYSLGRGIEGRDHCAVERIVAAIEPSGHGARSLVREIVLSTPFRYKQVDGGSAACCENRPR